MALNWKTLAGGNFSDTLFNYLKVAEGPAPGTGDLFHPVMVGGNPTIGVGFDLVMGGKPVQDEVLLRMGLNSAVFDLTTPPPTTKGVSFALFSEPSCRVAHALS